MEFTPLFQQLKQVHERAENEAVVLRVRIRVLLELQRKSNNQAVQSIVKIREVIIFVVS
jgi:hypothetical protein